MHELQTSPWHRPSFHRAPVMRLGLLACAAALALSGPVFAQAQPQAERSLPYVVKPSDKLIRLSRELLADPRDWTKVARFNRLRDPNLVRPGQRLEIPLSLLKSQDAQARLLSAEGSVASSTGTLQAGAQLAEGSRVETGANSTAVLELGDGSRVKLLPGSLAEIVSNRGYAMRDPAGTAQQTWYSGLIRLVHGSLEAAANRLANRATPMEIVTPTSVVGVRGTEFRVSHDTAGEGASRTEVTEGQVRADHTRQSTGADLPRGFGAAIRPSEREVRAVALLAAPSLDGVAPELARTIGSALTVRFGVVGGAAAYRAIVAADAGFTRIVNESRTTEPVIELRQVPAGSWHLLARAIDANGLQGFDAVKVVAIRDVSPPPAPPPPSPRVTTSFMRHTEQGTMLRLQLDQALVGAAQLTLARDEGFSQTVGPVQQTVEEWNLGTLAAGVYHLRLSGRVAGYPEPVRSETYRFEISPNWGLTVFDSSFPLQPLRP